MRKPSGKIYTLDDLFHYCSIGGETDCIEWLYSTNNHGYGKVSFQNRVWLTHRLSFILANPEKDITGVLICHSCDNPVCCNPDHLFEGTHQHNTVDMIHKGRNDFIGMVGEDHHQSKLTRSEVNEIRERYALGGIYHKELAVMYGVSKSLISQIIREVIWK